MAFQKLTRPEVRALRHAGGRGANDDYVNFLSDIGVGSGGKVLVAGAQASRQTVKNRLDRAAAAVGKEIKYHRSGPETVVFEVVG